MSLKGDDSDQSISMGRSDEENEAATSFLNEDFLSCPVIETASNNARGNNNNINNGQKHHGNGTHNSSTSTDGAASIPWLTDRKQQQGNGSSSHASSSSHRQGGGRGYSNYYYEPPPLIQLHNEIVSFVKLMEPTREELDDRDRMVDRVTRLAERTFKSCEVHPFGSQRTGLCLPNSDIDFVIRFPKHETKGKSKSDAIELDRQENDDDDDEATTIGNPLHAFAKAVRDEFGVKSELHTQDESTEEYLSYLEVIENTRVPLVKFTIEPYNIDIDVCFDQPGGPEAADLMHRFMSSMPPLRPLTFVLKYFLASRDINKPFTGGIGSYLLQLMIVSFLQHRSREDLNRVGRIDNMFNLGSLLVDFLEFYGIDLNYCTTGISVRNDGYYFAKGERDKKETFWLPSRPFSLAMENPLDPGMDVGGGAYRVQTIQRVFQHSFQTLLAYVAEPRERTDSILARIIPPTEEMEKRRLYKLSLPDDEDAGCKHNNGSNKIKKRHSSNGGHYRDDKKKSKKHKSDRRDSGGSQGKYNNRNNRR